MNEHEEKQKINHLCKITDSISKQTLKSKNTQNFSPSYCPIITCNLCVCEVVQPHVICLLSSSTSPCSTFLSWFGWASGVSGGASSSSSASWSNISCGGRLASITLLDPTRLLCGLSSSFSITVVLTPQSPKQEQENKWTQYLHIWGNIKN